jgi:hypothetical protein
LTRSKPLRRKILISLSLAAAIAAVCLLAAPVAAARDPECEIILPAADRLETAFNSVPSAALQPDAGVRVSNAESPLFGLVSPAAIDLRLWSSTLALHINRASAYDAATPARIASDLQQARRQLVAARQYCAL